MAFSLWRGEAGIFSAALSTAHTAKVDTGASRMSVDTDLAARVGQGPVADTARVMAASSIQAELRHLVEARIQREGKEFRLPVSIADRADMEYPAIIG